MLFVADIGCGNLKYPVCSV